MPRIPGERSIAITRPVGKGEKTAEFVRKLGWSPFIVHAVELKPIERSIIHENFSKVINGGYLDWLVFMSSAGVDAFFDMLRSHSRTLPSAMGKIRIMAVGPKTSEALERRGVRGTIVPEDYSSSGIASYLSKFGSKGHRVVLVRSSAADERLATALVTRGLAVETITTYESVIPANLESAWTFLSELEKGQFQAVLFTSAVSASNMFSIAEGHASSQLVQLLRPCIVGAIGPATAEKLEELGVSSRVPGRYLIEDAIEGLVNEYEKKMVVNAGAFS
jgi:uroporphyrinogen III methyltransferase / synthase